MTHPGGHHTGGRVAVRPSPIASPRALPPDADRDRVARAARLRHDHQQPLGELGRGPAAAPTSARARPRRAAALLRRPPRRSAACARPWPPAAPALARRRRPGHRRAPPPRCSRPRPRCSSPATTRWSCAPTTPPTSRRRAPSAPTVDVVDLRFDDGWQLDVERSRRACARTTRADQRHVPAQPDRARCSTATTLDALVELAERHGGARAARRRDLPRPHPRRAAADGRARCARGRSASPRCRRPTGCPACGSAGLVCRDPELAEPLLAAKEQMLICGADARRGDRGPCARPRATDPARRSSTTSRATLAIVRDWMAGQSTLRVGRARRRRGRPRRASVPRSRRHRPLLRLAARRARHLRRARPLVRRRPPFRLGFAWPATEELERGLAGLLAAAADAG